MADHEREIYRVDLGHGHTIKDMYLDSDGYDYVRLVLIGTNASCDEIVIVVDGEEAELNYDSTNEEWQLARKIADETTVGSETSLERLYSDSETLYLARAKNATNVDSIKYKITTEALNDWGQPSK